MATLVCQASKYIFALWCTGLKHFNVLPTFSIVHKGLPCLVYKDGSIHDKFLLSLLQSWPCFENNNIHRTREKPTGIKGKKSFPSVGRFHVPLIIWQQIKLMGHNPNIQKFHFRASLLEAQQQEKAERERKEKEAAEAREKQKWVE